MNIKSLELIGFKSFYNKASIEFHKGINAIVGPNGCGKSNLIDAIRWILGEQNSRLLRADGSMEELISNGSEKLNPLGMAEATMVIENVPGSGFEEIAIKRRLYRSGESEYYINGVRCRLKDIREMFMDTGVGSRAYSIIGQGKVEEFITAKPEDKRKLIEEVAGIVKYKTRRKETQSRLESTRDNLSRIKDMKSEVSRQMNSLSRQAKNAENYKKLSKEARLLELRILSSKKDKLGHRISELSAKKSELQKKISDLVNLKREKSRELEKQESENTSLDERISLIEDEIFKLRSELNDKNSFQNYASKEVRNIDLYVERLLEEIESLTGEKKDIQRNVEQKKSDVNNLNDDISILNSKITKKSEELQNLKNESSSRRKQLQDTREKIFETINRHSNSKESLFATNKELEELSLRKSRAFQEKKDLSDEIENGEKQKQEYESEIDHIRSAKQRLETEIEEKKNKLSDCKSENQQLMDKLSDLKEEFNHYRSRLDALKQIQSNYEWLPEVTREFLMKSKGNGILGVITDYISAPRNYEKALEAALAEKLNWVVVSESREAVEAVENLRQSSMGRSTFIPLNNEYRAGNFDKNGINAQMINEIVEVNGIDREMINSILDGIFVVSDLQQAFELKQHVGNGASFVTLDGDHLDSSGAVTGGYTTGGVFERKTEIAELQDSMNQKEEELTGLKSRSDSLKQKIESDEADISEIEKEVRSADIELIEKNKDLSNLESSIKKNRERAEYLKNEIENTEKNITEKESSVESLKADTAGLENEKARLNNELTQYEQEISELDEREKMIEHELGSLKVENASLVEKKRALEYEVSELESRFVRTEEKISEKENEIENKKKQKDELYNSIDENKSEISRMSGLIEEKQKLLSDTRVKKQNEREQLKKNRGEADQLDQQIEDIREQNSQVEVKLNSAQIEHQHVTEQTQKLKDGEESELCDEPHDSINLEEAEERLSVLKKKIDRFGLVNLLAPEEYKNLEERHSFLEEQTQDLEEAMESLKKAMNKLDRESVTRFREAFEIINTKFQETLSRLFTGGEGKLVIVDPEDILETGVEVMVKPRGKKYQSINLLSGGEKALSAIALIISACFVKPVPFLILDEIDAPLDEANTVRFTELIREIANESQVIIITHNKVTMQAVDSLIGVTSDRSVTSKIVSVDMQAQN